MHPALHRLDLRTPGAAPARVGAMTSSSHAAPSPDGTRIAYACGTGICVAAADGSGASVVPGFSQTTGPLGDQPAWSPDGTRIAFRGWAPGGTPGMVNPTDVWVMNADGSGKARLTDAAAGVDYYAAPAWSPRRADGSYRLAFSHGTRGADGYERAAIESMRADGQDRRPVTAPGAHLDGEPTWSPDGGTIAFVRTGGEVAGDVWLADAAGGRERALMAAAVEPSGAQRAPAWSPDGALIAFASDHEILGTYFAWQIYTVRADGTGLVRRTDGRADTGNPAWIPRR
jgi:Tol biopolymer transport system component